MSSFKVINAPLSINTSSANLINAIANAQPGAVITVTEAGAPLDLNLSGIVKGGCGVHVVLPPDQIICAVINNCEGIHFVGGTWAADEVRGTFVSNNYGLSLLPGTKKVSLRGARFGSNSYCVRGGDNIEDILLSDNMYEGARADSMHFTKTDRLEISDNVVGQGPKGRSFCYYNDGRDPQQSISTAACTSGGGIWQDGPHEDVLQMWRECADVIVKDNIIETWDAQGIVTFGFDEEPNANNIYRVRVEGNDIYNASLWAIGLTANDATVVDNVVHSRASPSYNTRIRVVRVGEDSRIQGARNVALDLSGSSGVDFGAAEMNGDEGVLQPEAPRVVIPAWVPATNTPDPSPMAPPRHIVGGGARVGGVAAGGDHSVASVGNYLSLNRGSVTGSDGATWEYRWKRNGSVISGATLQVYQVVSADIGTVITPEIRGTNDAGTGEWYPYGGVTVQ